jgi:hypothetical protein
MFNETELSEMRQFYLSQLADAEKKVSHIRGILIKLGGVEGGEISAPAAAAPVAEEVAAPAAEAKVVTAYVSYLAEDMLPKRGRGSNRPKERKSEWGQYVQNTLRQQNRLMTLGEMVDHAMKRAKNHERGENKVRLSLSGPINRMVTNTFRLRSMRIEGKRSPFYGLAGWFNADGSLKAPYNAQFGNVNVVLKKDEGEA